MLLFLKKKFSCKVFLISCLGCHYRPIACYVWKLELSIMKKLRWNVILFYSPFDNICYCLFQTHKLWQGSLNAGLGLHFEIIPFPSILDMFVSYNVVNFTMLFQMQCGKWIWDQVKQWNLDPTPSELESQTVLITSEQAFVDLGQHVASIILLTESWYSCSMYNKCLWAKG